MVFTLHKYVLFFQVLCKHPQVLQTAEELNIYFYSAKNGERFVSNNQIAFAYTNNIQNFSFQSHLTETLPYPFNEELQGIANSSGVPLGNSLQCFVNIMEN